MQFPSAIGGRTPATRVIRWFLAILTGMGVGIWGGLSVLSGFPGGIAVVQGLSMVPTFEPGARVFTVPVNGRLKRGDIVIVQDGLNGRAIKRIVGLPGEKVSLWRGYVFINGQLLREPYLPKYTFTHPDLAVNRSTFALGNGNYFVLGDNRESSYDSRNYGPLCQGDILAMVPQVGAIPPEFAAYALPVYGRQNAETKLP